MKLFKQLLSAAVITLMLCANSFAGETHSGRAVVESGKASTHASASIAHGIAGSGQVVSAVAAVPFYAIGSIGEVSKEVGVVLMEAATAPIGTPLIITEETVTAGPPPNHALKE